MKLSNVKIIWQTEMLNHVRDRRALLALLGFALMGPVGIFAMFFVIDNLAGEERKIKLDIIGADNAHGLVYMLEQEDIEITRRDEPVPDNISDRIPEMGEAEVLLVIPNDYATLYNANIPAVVTIYRDDTSQRSTLVARQVQGMIRTYSQEVAASRLVARGVPGQTVSPILPLTANVAPKDAQSLQLASFLLYFLMIVPFYAGMSVTIDTTAGERERGSLLPLMAQPVSAGGLAVGKFLSVVSFGLVAQIVATLATFNVLHFLPTDTLQINIPLDILTQLKILVVLAPLALIAAPLQIFFALSSKSYKEAQSYLQILAILPIGLVIYGTLVATRATGVEQYLPIIAQSDMMRQVVATGSIPLVQWVVALVIAVAICTGALIGARRKLSHESLLRVA